MNDKVKKAAEVYLGYKGLKLGLKGIMIGAVAYVGYRMLVDRGIFPGSLAGAQV